MTGAAPTLSICMRCRLPEWRGADEDRPGAIRAIRLGAALQRAPRPVRLDVRHIRCMSQCKRPCVVAFTDPHRFTYLFGDLDPDRHVGDVLATVDLWLDRPEGFVERFDRPSSMQAGILGRIPPLESRHPFVESESRLDPDRSE